MPWTDYLKSAMQKLQGPPQPMPPAQAIQESLDQAQAPLPAEQGQPVIELDNQPQDDPAELDRKIAVAKAKLARAEGRASDAQKEYERTNWFQAKVIDPAAHRAAEALKGGSFQQAAQNVGKKFEQARVDAAPIRQKSDKAQLAVTDAAMKALQVVPAVQVAKAVAGPTYNNWMTGKKLDIVNERLAQQAKEKAEDEEDEKAGQKK